MPPHCDSRDGPVVKAALAALAAGNVHLILPFVPADKEAGLRSTFDAAVRAVDDGPNGAHAAQEWLLETAVRLHREAEGAPFDGLKPAGMNHGPVLPLGEEAIATGDPSRLVEFLKHAVEEAVQEKFARAMDLAVHDKDDVPAARAYTSAMLEFLVFSHHVYKGLLADNVHERNHDAH